MPICPCGKPARNSRAKYCSEKHATRAKAVASYGLTFEEYYQLIGDGRCFICQRKIKKWNVDHDHKTGETRGVICSGCNTHLVSAAMGDPAVAARLVIYLQNPPARQLTGEPRYITESREKKAARSQKRLRRRRRMGQSSTKRHYRSILGEKHWQPSNSVHSSDMPARTRRSSRLRRVPS